MCSVSLQQALAMATRSKVRIEEPEGTVTCYNALVCLLCAQSAHATVWPVPHLALASAR